MPNNLPDSPQCIRCKTRILPTFSLAGVPAYTFRANIAPTNTDITRTKANLEEEEQEIRRYDEEIQYASLFLEKLKAQKEVLLQKMEERRSWLAPVRRLPVEILEKIFLEVPEKTLQVGGFWNTKSKGYRFSVKATSLSLTHVSCHWRNVANGTRSLWSSIEWKRWKKPMRRDLTPLLDIYLRNAADAPLHVFIDVYNRDAMPALRKVQDWKGRHELPFLQTLVGQFSRCEQLSVNCLEPTVLQHALQDTEGKTFPKLRKLLYKRNGPILGSDGSMPINGRFWDAIRYAPRLEYIDVDAIAHFTEMEIFHPGSILPWDQLQIIHMTNLDSYTDFRVLITHCPLLEEIQVEEAFEFDDGLAYEEIIEPVVLPWLQVLDFGPERAEDLHSILASLSLPSLKRLDIGLGRFV
ncbi:hypothetical protein VNI00_017212 [Paramarasmius palmivorus]|uniref:F-box domain-containing protein n=1 Tax=Paramarasmius palmivorus TaxID=297713 RepID=A0AAW0B6S7_9AGAR